MKISDIYSKYKIMPNLQEHMLRVASVAKIISDNMQESSDKHLIISAALIHDIGNMSKFKLEAFPEFTQPKGFDYWNKVLTEFKNRYGNDDYKATYSILRELRITNNIYGLVKSLEFAKAPQTAKDDYTELKVCLYSDARVSPNGVVSLKERLSEVKNRYMKNKGISEEKFNQIAESLYKIEEQIFASCKIKPEDITEEKVEPLLRELINFEISNTD